MVDFLRLILFIITPANKHVKGCHAGLDPASIPNHGFPLSRERPDWHLWLP
jgi:hypothetical protein